MIRPLRRLHRVLFLVLIVALPIALWIALASREPPAAMEELPSALEGPP